MALKAPVAGFTNFLALFYFNSGSLLMLPDFVAKRLIFWFFVVLGSTLILAGSKDLSSSSLFY
jgi:hypothetical protein